MERKITDELFKWSKDGNRKPLLIYGVSGCGKTYSVLEFGEKEYKNVIYFDCINNIELEYVFLKNNTIEKLIRGLSAISLQNILVDETLIIFDNITEKTMTSIKKMFLGTSYHVIMLTNSKKMYYNKSTEFNLKIMSLVTFPEYLKYIGKEQMITFIEESFATNSPMPFHNLAFEYFNDFIITGGYPDSVVNFVENKKVNLLNSYHQKNILLLKNYLFNLDNLIDIKRGLEVYDNMYFQLVKDNKKFQYGLLRTGGRSKEYESSINYLTDNDTVYISNKISEIKSPLNKLKEEDCFKLYYNDTGILFKKMNACFNKLLTDDRLLNILYENNVAVSLKNNGFNLYYYQSNGKAGLDFVIQTRTGKIIPIELIISNMSKSKSLALAMNKYNLNLAIRIGNDNFSFKKNIKYIPYYASFCIKESI